MPALLDWVLHLDTHLAALAASHGLLVYGILFGVIFVETGVVVLPFLPGDSLLFVAGALAAKGVFSLPVLLPLLVLAAIGGDAVNFAVGATVRTKAIEPRHIRFIKAEYIDRTREFFDRHGRKTIILARFVPVVRTLAPFVAALGSMPYHIFLIFNVIGGLAWVSLLIGAGFLFGNVAWIGDHLTMVLLGIVLLSVLPAVLAWAKNRAKAAA